MCAGPRQGPLSVATLHQPFMHTHLLYNTPSMYGPRRGPSTAGSCAQSEWADVFAQVQSHHQ